MQYTDKKTLHLRKVLSQILTDLRKNNTKLSCNGMEISFGFSSGSLNRIENANVDCKFITLWRIAEALDMKPSELVKLIEDKLGDNFKLIDE